MDTSVGYRAFTLTNREVQGGSLVLHTLLIVATKQKVVRNVRVMQLIKEVKYFLRNILSEQLVRVLIISFVCPWFLWFLGLQVHACQFGIGHIHSLPVCQTTLPAYSRFIIQITLPQLEKNLRCVHIILTVVSSLCLF